MIRKNRKYIFAATLGFIIFCSVAVFVYFSEKEVDLLISIDMPMPTDCAGMYNVADYVVVGRYGSMTGTMNASRDPQDISKESEDEYFENRIYEFFPCAVVKGNVDAERISISRPYSETREIMTALGKDNLKTYDPFFYEPDTGKTYMLFLKYDKYFDLYYAAAEPFSIELSENGEASLVTNLISPDFTSRVNQRVTSSRGRTVNVALEYGTTSYEDKVSGLDYTELLEKMNVLPERVKIKNGGEAIQYLNQSEK